MSAEDSTPARSPRPLSTLARQDRLISPANLTLLIGFAILVTIVALFILPANPDKSWVAGAANAMIWISVSIVPGFPIVGAVYRLNANFRAMVQHFRFMRIGLFSLAILLPPAIGFLAYGIVLLQRPTQWNRLIFALICGPLVAGGVLAVIAHAAGQLAYKELRDYFAE